MKKFTEGLIRSPVLWSALACLAFWWFLAFVITNILLMEIVRIVQISVGIAVIMSYARYATEGMLSGRPSPAQQLAMGICIGFLGTVLNGVWSLLWRLAKQPYWMPNSDVNGFTIYLIVLAACLHLTTRTLEGEIPRRKWLVLGISTGIGVFLGLLVVILQEHITLDLDWLHPFVGAIDRLPEGFYRRP